MADFSAPSFSLGIDLDCFQPPPPPANPKKQVECGTIVISSQSIEDDDDDDDDVFQPQTLTLPDPLIFKRLKRGGGPPTTHLYNNRRPSDVDEIEDADDFSSPPHLDHPKGDSAVKNRSACSSSKFSSNGFIPLSTQLGSKSKFRDNTQASNAAPFTSMEASSSKTVFPKLTISPLRRFQLLDSDSDDPSFSEDLFEDAKKVDVSASERQHIANPSLNANQQKRDKITGDKLQTEDLWKDFGPQKSVNIPTPALDEFCEEYFSSVKDKDLVTTKDENICTTSSKVQKNVIGGNVDSVTNLNGPLPPAYKYFYHDDPRIQKLVHQRLPNFFPLGVKNTETPHAQAADIEYMCQFSQKEPTCWNQGLEGSSRMKRKNIKQSHSKALSEISGSWVNPKSCTSTSKNSGRSQGQVAGGSSGYPKNAGKRRVRADGCSSGSWFTGEDGRKIYVTKNGEELTGQMAYRRYKKELSDPRVILRMDIVSPWTVHAAGSGCSADVGQATTMLVGFELPTELVSGHCPVHMIFEESGAGFKKAKKKAPSRKKSKC